MLVIELNSIGALSANSVFLFLVHMQNQVTSNSNVSTNLSISFFSAINFVIYILDVYTLIEVNHLAQQIPW